MSKQRNRVFTEVDAYGKVMGSTLRKYLWGWYSDLKPCFRFEHEKGGLFFFDVVLDGSPLASKFVCTRHNIFIRPGSSEEEIKKEVSSVHGDRYNIRRLFSSVGFVPETDNIVLEEDGTRITLIWKDEKYGRIFSFALDGVSLKDNAARFEEAYRKYRNSTKRKPRAKAFVKPGDKKRFGRALDLDWSRPPVKLNEDDLFSGTVRRLNTYLKRWAPFGLYVWLSFSAERESIDLWSSEPEGMNCFCVKAYVKWGDDVSMKFLTDVITDIRKTEKICHSTGVIMFGRKFMDNAMPVDIVDNPHYKSAAPMKLYCLSRLLMDYDGEKRPVVDEGKIKYGVKRIFI